MITMISGSFLMVKVILILFVLVLTACNKDSQPNYLFILVENFNSKTIYCNNDETIKTRSGFDVICDEFNRFTHVYTTSIQALPAYASLLTGLYPYSHNVRTNSDSFLSPEFKTHIEALKEKKNYHTSFISGGEPFFRKSGIHQGFDVFDDHITSDKDFRPIKEQLPIFFDQLKEDRNSHFFTVMHVADLKYPLKETQNELGEIRNLTFESQIEEVDEKLFLLFKKMKSEKVWDNTKVFIIGLNGKPNIDFNLDFSQLSLKSDNTQVAFYFKDVKKNAINSKPQTINTLLSFKDIGSIFLNHFSSTSTQNKTESSELKELESFKKPSDEYLVIESAWAKSNTVGEIRAAIIDENQLFIYDKQMLLYNKLSDSNEQYPQPINNHSKDKVNNYVEYLLAKNFVTFDLTKEATQFISDIEALNRSDFSSNKRSEFYDYFLLLNYIEKKDLKKIDEIKKKYSVLQEDSCLKYFPSTILSSGYKKKCPSTLFNFFVDYSLQQKSVDKEMKAQFLTEVSNFNILKNAYRKNLMTDLDYFKRELFKVENLKDYFFYATITN